ncbi:MAG: aldo/keto reductase [Candidatus Rokubacteria bacterium]|nr:aldo/keto reductase [Candidatus Rokubacteria bacterium]
MLKGRATSEGTAAYRAAQGAGAADDHFREWRGLSLSSVGIGTYLGPDDDATDALYEAAVKQAVASGINVVDSAVNYRHQRSERAVGRALGRLVRAGSAAREGVVVATKGGFLPFDGPAPPGLLRSGDLVAGCHCMTPRYLEDQIERSRVNLDLETIDIYYLHNPETQLGELPRREVTRRLRAAFEFLEGAARDRRIGLYGTATWSGYRQPQSARDFLSLPDLVALAEEVGGPEHRFRVVQLPYNLAMTEAFTLANQGAGREPVPLLESARRLDVYVMSSASIYQGQLAKNLPAVIPRFLPGLDTDAQRALQFVRSTPGVGTALVGMKTLAHVAEAARLCAVSPVPWSEFQKFFAPA